VIFIASIWHLHHIFLLKNFFLCESNCGLFVHFFYNNFNARCPSWCQKKNNNIYSSIHIKCSKRATHKRRLCKIEIDYCHYHWQKTSEKENDEEVYPESNDNKNGSNIDDLKLESSLDMNTNKRTMKTQKRAEKENYENMNTKMAKKYRNKKTVKKKETNEMTKKIRMNIVTMTDIYFRILKKMLEYSILRKKNQKHDESGNVINLYRDQIIFKCMHQTIFRLQ
ncbi:hypothetical protein RFI_30889, partial [Reticulomyxa filosa]